MFDINNDHIYHYDNDYQVFVIDDDDVDDLHGMNYVDDDDDVCEIYNDHNYHHDDDDDDVDDDPVNVNENDHHEMIYSKKN